MHKTAHRLAALLAMILLLSVLSSCGSISPSARIAEGFFDAVRAEDAKQWKKLLDPATREQFEAAMGDAELTAYLRDANKSLADQYGASWRDKLRILSAVTGPGNDAATEPVSAVATGKKWTVTVSIDGDTGGKQDIPVLEWDGQYWLDLSSMDMVGSVREKRK